MAKSNRIIWLSQLISKPPRVMETSSTIIAHVYTSHPENVTEGFVSFFLWMIISPYVLREISAIKSASQIMLLLHIDVLKL